MRRSRALRSDVSVAELPSFDGQSKNDPRSRVVRQERPETIAERERIEKGCFAYSGPRRDGCVDHGKSR